MIGKALGPYQIVAKLGEGGMGAVYRGRDARLNRDVAIKVLPAAFASDPERLARFTREAQTLAALNHPGIAHVHGLEEIGTVQALVMELVEGDDLSAHLARGPMPLPEVLAVARQIAAALEAAHDQGIIHRDLKPGNVKVRPDGTVKVLDFGLAKILETGSGSRASGPGTIENSPTITSPATLLGMIIGTAAYMSPEQARGRAVDKRADIWAFGVVLYEALTGTRAFAGEEISDVLAAVLRQEIDWAALPATTPPRLRRLLERCLDRDPKTRLRDIGEARVELALIESGAREPASVGPPAAPAPSRSREGLAWAVAGVATIAAIAFPYTRPAAIVPQSEVVSLAFAPPPGVTFEAGRVDAIVVSPDGRQLVFTGRSTDGKRQLFVRAMDGTGARALPGTDEPIKPFWSPDSRSVAFGARGKLSRVDLAGGLAIALTDAPRLNGGAWNRDGVILFSPDYNAGLHQVSDKGGAVTVVATLDAARKENAIADPAFLPDGRHFLYTLNSTEQNLPTGAQIRWGTLGGPENGVVVDGSRARFAWPDRLLFERAGTLFASRFDPDRRMLEGNPIPLAEPASDAETVGRGENGFSVSDTGVLVWKHLFAPEYQLGWFDRQGRSIGAIGAPTRLSGDPYAPRLSPDGAQLAFQDRSSDVGRRGIWVMDLQRNLATRVLASLGQYPQWSADGRELAWTMPFNSVVGIYKKAATGVGTPDLLLRAGAAAGGGTFLNDWSKDGRYLLYHTRGEKTRIDVWALPMFGDRKPHPVLITEFDDGPAQLSPDGKWLAYQSDLSGTPEIYVQSFTTDGQAGGERVRISTRGGSQPRFRPDSQELFYLADDGRLMSVSIKRGSATFEHGEPTALFKTRTLPRIEQVAWEYDVTRDGQRFVVGTILDGPHATPPAPTIVLNWTAGLK